MVDDPLALQPLADAGVAAAGRRSPARARRRGSGARRSRGCGSRARPTRSRARCEQLRERQARRARADDRDLRALVSPRLPRARAGRSRTRCSRPGRRSRPRDCRSTSLISSAVRPFRSARADVHRELLVVAERDQRGQRDAAARPAVEARARPDLAPRVAGDQVLEVGGERRSCRSTARSTCSSPSTSRRTRMPSSRAHQRGRSQQSVELVGLLDVREVRGVGDHHEARAGDRRRRSPRPRPGGDGRVVGARDRERRAPRSRRARPRGSQRGERLAAARVALGRRRRGTSRGSAGTSPNAGVNQRAEHRVGDRLQPVARARARARSCHCCGLAEARRRARERRAVEPLGRVEREPHADGAAEREADEGEPLALHAASRTRRARSPTSRTLDHRLRRRGRGGRSRTTSKSARARRPARPTSRVVAAERAAEDDGAHRAGRTRARGRRTRRPSRDSPPARARRARSARPRRASPRERFARMRSASTSRPSSDRAQRRRRAAGVRERVGERLPLRVPGAGRALVLVLEVRASTPAAARTCSRTGAREHRPDRVALVRHRRRPPPSGSAHLADLGLREQREVERDLRAAPGGDRERGAELGERRAARVPRQRPARGRSSSAANSAQHLDARVAERGERPAGAAELRGQARTRRGARARATTPTSQLAAFSPNVVGTACCSSVRAAITVARCSSASLAQAAATPSSSSSDDRRRVARDEHRGGVEDVLARRAVMDVLRISPDLRERAHERLDRVTRRRGLRARARRRRELASQAARHAAASSARPASDCAWASARSALEHRPQPRVVDDGRAQLVRNEERVKRLRKNTVCRSPCRRMSKTQHRPPLTCSAIERRRHRSRRSLRSSGSRCASADA